MANRRREPLHGGVLPARARPPLAGRTLRGLDQHRAHGPRVGALDRGELRARLPRVAVLRRLPRAPAHGLPAPRRARTPPPRPGDDAPPPAPAPAPPPARPP